MNFQHMELSKIYNLLLAIIDDLERRIDTLPPTDTMTPYDVNEKSLAARILKVIKPVENI